MLGEWVWGELAFSMSVLACPLDTLKKSARSKQGRFISPLNALAWDDRTRQGMLVLNGIVWWRVGATPLSPPLGISCND